MYGERPTYESKTQQLVTFAVLLVGKNTVFRFPRLLFIHGGLPFLLAYTTFMLSVMIPIMHLENTLGQFSGHGNLGIFDASPVFRGLGYTMTYYFTVGLVAFGTESSYEAVLLVNAFQSRLPWADCFQPWIHDTDACYVPTDNMVLCSSVRDKLVERFFGSGDQQGVPVTNGRNTSYVPRDVYTNASSQPCLNGTLSSVHLFVEYAAPLRLFLRRNILRHGYHPWDIGGMHTDFALTTAALWMITFLFSREGIHRAKYAFYAIGTVYILTMLLLLGYTLTLTGTALGISLLFRGRLWKTMDPMTWRDALKVSISNIGIYGGSFLNAVRFNTFKNDFRYDILAVIMMELSVNILCGIIVFIHVGYLATVRGVDADQVLNSYSDIQHEIITEVLTVSDPTGAWCVIYSVWVLSNALGFMMLGPEVLLEVLFYEFPDMKSISTECSFFACCGLYLLGLVITTEAGSYVIGLLSHKLGLMAAIMMLMEMSVFLRVYGMPRIMVDYRTMIGQYPSLAIRIIWAAIVPLSLLILIAMEFFLPVEFLYLSHSHGSWNMLIAMWLLCFGFSFTVVYAYACLSSHYFVWDEVSRPLKTWRPESREDFQERQRLLWDFGLGTKRSLDVTTSVTQSRTSVQADTTGETTDVREAVTSERSVSFAPDLPASYRSSPANFNEAMAREFGLTMKKHECKPSYLRDAILQDRTVLPPELVKEEVQDEDYAEGYVASPDTPPVVLAVSVRQKEPGKQMRKKKEKKRRRRRRRKAQEEAATRATVPGPEVVPFTDDSKRPAAPSPTEVFHVDAGEEPNYAEVDEGSASRLQEATIKGPDEQSYTTSSQQPKSDTSGPKTLAEVSKTTDGEVQRITHPK